MRFKKSMFFLLITYFLILSLFLVVFLVGQQDISDTEQRTLQHIPSFTVKSFLDTTYQKELEESVSDQIIISKDVKKTVMSFNNLLTSKYTEVALKIKQKDFPIIASIKDSIKNKLEESKSKKQTEKVLENEKGRENKSQTQRKPVNQKLSKPVQAPANVKFDYQTLYMKVAPGVYRMDDSGYIIWKSTPPSDFTIEYYNLEKLEKVTYPSYIYFVNSSSSVDFTDMAKYDFFAFIKKMMHVDYYGQLSFASFEEYKKYFYQTDHHWNYRGSYKGYCDIMHMLEGYDVVLHKPLRKRVFNAIYNGSLARGASLKCSNEKFTVYEFDLPPCKTFINDKEGVYGSKNLYIDADNCPHELYTNHYATYYGADFAKVVYQFDNPDAENILILATSFSNAVNELIASHYKETHILDFRHYYKLYGHTINIQSYMDENHLTKLLMIGDIGSFFKRDE